MFAILVISALFGSLCCSKKEPPAATKAETPQPAAPGPPAPAAASLIPPEEVSEASAATPSGKLVLPVSFERRTGDLDVMMKERNIRALVLLNPISFFYDQGKPRGMTCETLDVFERYVNKKYKTGALKVKVTFIPMRPDKLAPALSEGIGDFVAYGVAITPEREQQFAFTIPTMENIDRIVITGNEQAQPGRSSRRHAGNPQVCGGSAHQRSECEHRRPEHPGRSSHAGQYHQELFQRSPLSTR